MPQISDLCVGDLVEVEDAWNENTIRNVILGQVIAIYSHDRSFVMVPLKPCLMSKIRYGFASIRSLMHV